MNRLWEKALEEISSTLEQIDAEQNEQFSKRLFDSGRIFCAAAGRSKMILSAFAMRMMHMGYEVHMVGDVTTPGISEGDTLLLVSGSGETRSLVAMAEKAEKTGAAVLLVTANESSTLSDLSKAKVVLHSVNKLYNGEKSVQPGANRFEQSALIYLDLLVAEYMSANNLSNEDLMKRHANLE